MNDLDVVAALTIVAIVGAGLNAGVFFTFSTFTMAALRRLPDSEGAAAMQAVNIEAPKPAFMLIFLGTGLVSLIIGLLVILQPIDSAAVLRLSGAALYVASIVITGLYNVPLNNKLAAVDPRSQEGILTWTDYQRSWTRGNHVRTIVCTAAAAVLAVSLLL